MYLLLFVLHEQKKNGELITDDDIKQNVNAHCILYRSFVFLSLVVPRINRELVLRFNDEFVTKIFDWSLSLEKFENRCFFNLFLFCIFNPTRILIQLIYQLLCRISRFSSILMLLFHIMHTILICINF